MTDLEIIDDKKFITLQKWTPALCLFLTGKTPKAFPLARTRIFEAMRIRVKVAVNEMTVALEEAMVGAIPGADKVAADRALSLLCKDATCQRVRTTRSHHASKCKSMLAKYGVVKMNVGRLPWEPTCVLTPTTANVTMEATAENFEALFNIVKCDLTNVRSPLRKLKRRPSNTHYRKATPR